MKEQHTGKASAKGGTTDWKRLDSLSDKEIRSAIEADPEARPTDANFWKKAKVTLPRPKQTITIRLDADLLGSARQVGPGGLERAVDLVSRRPKVFLLGVQAGHFEQKQNVLTLHEARNSKCPHSIKRGHLSHWKY